MPKVTYNLPTPDKELVSTIKKDYGGMLTLAQVCGVLCVSRDTARKFMKDVPAYNINGRRRWSATDLARRLAEVRCY